MTSKDLVKHYKSCKKNNEDNCNLNSLLNSTLCNFITILFTVLNLFLGA